MPSTNALTSLVIFSSLMIGLIATDQATSTPSQSTPATQNATTDVATPASAAQAATPGPIAPKPFASDVPAYRALDANLYMQTSAEYHACCLQAYRMASMLLNDASAKSGSRPRAVVLDLDETVIDNAGFQSTQLRSNLSFDDRLWAMWEQTGFDKLGLIPGATEFIADAKAKGVTVVYISNRSEKFREQTKMGLERLSLGITAEDQLLLATTTSDKTARRKQVEDAYDVLLYVGDNLRDFDDSFRSPKLPAAPTAADLDAAVTARKQTLQQHREQIGSKWIILPNPAYGEWTKPLGRGLNDLDRLAPVESK